MSELSIKNNKDQEISLRDILVIIGRGKWLIAGVSLAFGLAAGAASFLAPELYVAVSVVAPVAPAQSGGGSGLGALASQFGGLASLAGIATPGDSKKSESIAVLQSEALTEKYVRDNNLLPILFKDKWDSERQRWITANPKKIPTPWLANDYFKKKIRSVANDTKTGLVTLSITWTDPKVAATWANDLIRLTNENLRARAIRESEANIAYLTDQANKNNEIVVKQAIFSSLEGEINKIMIAKGSEEFAFRVLDPAVPPEKRASPQRVVWTIVGFLGGLTLSTLVVFYRNKQL